jgi:serine-type D-Ala-D-Ala carboxypeptidase/endopeptidase (penicillin-binding protein 4)
MMRTLFIFSCLLFCSYTYVPSPRDQVIGIQSDIERLLIGYEDTAHIGVKVVSLKNGQRIFCRAQDKLFVPASVLKIFTAAAALDLLGVDFRFETNIYALEKPENGAIRGDLYLKGGGDPSLTIEDLRNLAFQLQLKGIRCIEGSLIVDNTEFDPVPLGPGWMWDEGAEYWNSPLDALTVNHSCVDLWVEPPEKGSTPKITTFPQTDTVTILNLAQVGIGKEPISVKRCWATQDNIIEIKGMIPPDSPPLFFRVSIENPALYTGALFHNILKEMGITIQNEVKQADTPLHAIVLATHLSQPLRTLAAFMMKESDNLYANSFFKKVGARFLGVPGTWLKGAQAMRFFLQKKAGLDTTDFVIVDGSGESRYNLVSPHQIVQFLNWAHLQFSFVPEWIASFPIAGIDGSLRNRMTDASVRGKVRAKPGTMTGITALAGFAQSLDGEILIFSILTNGFVQPVKIMRAELEDQFATILTQFSRQ